LTPRRAESPQKAKKGRLTEAELRALEVLNNLAEKHAFSPPANPDDILVINNLAVLHRWEEPEAYYDGDAGDPDAAAAAADEGLEAGAQDDDADKKRRFRTWLMRLWLRNEKLGWAIPEAMRTPWEAAYGKERGRFVDDKYDLTPWPDYSAPGSTVLELLLGSLRIREL
jgi:hypothetical protein